METMFYYNINKNSWMREYGSWIWYLFGSTSSSKNGRGMTIDPFFGDASSNRETRAKFMILYLWIKRIFRNWKSRSIHFWQLTVVFFSGCLVLLSRRSLHLFEHETLKLSSVVIGRSYGTNDNERIIRFKLRFSQSLHRNRKPDDLHRKRRFNSWYQHDWLQHDI